MSWFFSKVGENLYLVIWCYVQLRIYFLFSWSVLLPNEMWSSERERLNQITFQKRNSQPGNTTQHEIWKIKDCNIYKQKLKCLSCSSLRQWEKLFQCNSRRAVGLFPLQSSKVQQTLVSGKVKAGTRLRAVINSRFQPKRCRWSAQILSTIVNKPGFEAIEGKKGPGAH